MAAGYIPWGSGSKLMAISEVFAFADESGIHDGARFCVVAGYMSTPDRWSDFNKSWRSILIRDSSPAFHAKAFFPRSGPYSGWGEELAATHIDGLLNALDQHDATLFCGTVDVDAFNALSYGERKILTGGIWNHQKRKWMTNGAPSKPYFLAFQHCMVEAAKAAASEEIVHFVFSDQPQFRVRALETFYESKPALDDTDRVKVGNCTFAPYEEATPLQAADMLAHCWHAFVTDERAMERNRRVALRRLTKRVAGFKIYNAIGLEMVLSRLPSEVRETIRKQTR